MLDPSILVGHGATPVGAGFQPPSLPVSAAPQTVVNPNQQLDRAEQASQTLASVLAMQCDLDASNTLEQAADQIVRTVQEDCSASEAILLWRSHPGKGLQIVARSGQGPEAIAQPDPTEVAVIVAAAEEIAARDTITDWPIAAEVQRHATLSVRQMADEQSIGSMLAIRLSNDDTAGRGVLMLVDPDNGSANSLLRVARIPLTGALIRIADNQPTRIDAALRSMVALTQKKRGRLTFAALILLALVMLLPVRYRISTAMELQPVQRRFIAVPFDGPLKQAHVKPGDTVHAGDLLATMDPREIEYEIAGSRAQWNHSEQQRKSLMVKHDFAGSKLAALDSERLNNQIDLLVHRRQRSEIRSPIDGVVVSGDPVQSEGIPMARGESLFEIAPLGEMTVMVAVPESDYSEVRSGMEVTFFVHAFPNRKIAGTIHRIHPKAELRGHENVFIAEVLLTDPDQIYRPGMQGKASIVGDRHTLGWNLFHPAYHAVRQTIGW